MNAPVTYTWDGEAMQPLPRFAKLCDQQFVIGERYTLEVVQVRSSATHNHYFACIEEAWRNLPELQSDRWPTAEHLRKWALVQAGYREESTFLCHSKAEALRFAAMLRSLDGFAIITVSDRMVVRAVAQSQSTKSMTKREFQQSKEAVLVVLGKLIGTPVEELRQNAGRAA